MVSVITATYNRSNVLRFAIESVRWQTHPLWEMIVVGDACTDDTAEVVASFKDPRLSFVNRAVNFGEHSGPHNDGLKAARGEFIAFLGHDDLWWPCHLDLALGKLREAKADLVFGRLFRVNPSGEARTDPPAGVTAYSPWNRIPASAWVFRRSLLNRVGTWRPATTLYNLPSQDWLFRAYRSGATLLALPRVTVVFISSVVREGSYQHRNAEDQERYFKLLRERPDFEPAESPPPPPEDVFQFPKDRLGPILSKPRSWWSLWETIRFVATHYPLRRIQRVALRFGVHPFAVKQFLQHGRKGGFVRMLRRRGGLPERPL